PWWHKLDIITDLCYWFLIPVIGRYLRIGLMVVAAAILFNITTADGLIAFYDNGHGPLAALPLVVQMIIFLVGEDVILYVIMVLTGISPNVLVVLGPLTVAHSAFVHANLDWTLGPFKYVIAGPVFHRWHHTAADRGGEKNFASTFPILDMIFGTFHMPKGELPDRYGVGEREYPTSFTAQLVHPFTQ
ncbi:MAG: sterol desaturase family protein, partial [Xanthobacteraceae bacterium]